MAENICNHLGLGKDAGLGWRLSQVAIEEDSSHPCTYRLYAVDVLEAMMLSGALNVIADELGNGWKFVAAM
jgi:hypothetical protein